jgi:hypothetical protein
MATVTMSPGTLAHHLRVAAERYSENTLWSRSLADQFTRQAQQCRAFADALDDIRSIGFAGDDIEVETIQE